jgi:hypothetical protein
MKLNPVKWKVCETDWIKVREALRKVCKDFCYAGFENRGNLTRKELEKEFFERAAEFYGFEIIWPSKEQGEAK